MLSKGLIRLKFLKSVRYNSNWIQKYVPKKYEPYLYLMRADKPIGTWLLFWPCAWSTCLAAPIATLPDPILIAKFAIGSILLRGAGCTINDMWDRDFDKNVERCKNRPLASGELNMKQAFGFLTLQLSAGLGLLLTFNPYSILVGLSSMPLVIIYPLMKRYTNWPQFVLGLTFNWGAFMGWSAIYNDISYSHILPLYISGICWTLVYDTLYGYQDRIDDIKLGLKSSAITIGDKPQFILSNITSLMTINLLLTGYINELTLPYYGGIGLVTAHMLWQIWTADIHNSSNLSARFISNTKVGGLITSSIILGHFHFF